MIVNCWRRVLLVLGLLTPRQLCFNGPPQPSEEVPDRMYHSLSGDLSNTAWAQKRLINKLSGNTFGTGPSDSVIISAGPSPGTIYGTVPKIRALMMQNIMLYLAPILPRKSTIQLDAGFDPKNLRRSHKQDSTLKTHSQTMVLHLILCRHIKHIFWSG